MPSGIGNGNGTGFTGLDIMVMENVWLTCLVEGAGGRAGAAVPLVPLPVEDLAPVVRLERVRFCCCCGRGWDWLLGRGNAVVPGRGFVEFARWCCGAGVDAGWAMAGCRVCVSRPSLRGGGNADGNGCSEQRIAKSTRQKDTASRRDILIANTHLILSFFLYQSEKHAFVDFHPIFSAADSAFVDGAIL